MEPQITQDIIVAPAHRRFGAAQIAEYAADVLLQQSISSKATTADAFRQEILTTGWMLIRQQPVIAPLINLVNTLLWQIEQNDSLYSMRQAVAQTTEEFKRQLRQHALHAAEGALPLISDGATIITISYSTTIQYALMHAYRAGRRFHVICAESRPENEGRMTAAALASYGIPVTLMIDAAALAAVSSARLVLVGADMLSNQGLVSRVGTHALAMLAQSAGVPLYTLCGSEKFLPNGFCPPPLPHRPTQELWDMPPVGINIVNRVADLTPLNLISGIVTEQATLPVAAIEAWLAATRLHPDLTRVPVTVA